MDPKQDQKVGGDGAVFRDRSFGLLVFGIVEVLIGALCALLVPLSFAALWLSGGESSGAGSVRSMVPVLLIYVVFAVVFVAIGIGSIRARCWACDLMLSVSRIWLLTGIGVVLVIWAILPGMVRASVTTESLPPEFLHLATAVTLGILCLIYIVLPGAFMLFYRSPDVRATCVARDPESQLTNHLPPRLLTLVVMWGLAAISVVAVPAYNWVFPLFGVLLAGLAGVVPWMVVCMVCVGLAFGSFHRRPWAWWGGIAATVAATVATLATAVRVPPGDFLSALRLPDTQMDMLASVPQPGKWVVLLGLVAVWASMLIYLMTVRTYFVDNRPGADA